MIKKIGLALAALTLATAPAVAQSGYPGSVRVENHSGINAYITSITLTNVHGRTHQLLRPLHITPGYNRVINFDDGEGHGHCTYNVRATFDNGTAAERVMDVCNTYRWRIFDLDNDTE